MRLATFLFMLFTSLFSYSQNKINLDEIASGLAIPVDITFDHENNMYAVEKGGIIKRINFNSNQHEEVLNLTDRVNSGANERGLLGLAFHPDYATNGYVYVNYTGSGGHTRVSRFKRINNDGFAIEPTSEKVLMTITQPFNNHNAGDLNFGVDGYLYIAMGDGGSGGDPFNKSQDSNDRLGKMLRIDVNTEAQPYLIPSDNPYVNATDTLNEIWAMGLRNPWRFSFDQLTHDMWIADVGQNRWEELNFTPVSSIGGENYGWRCYEADQKYDFSECDESTEFTFPVHKYVTSSGGEGCSITGGFVSRDTTQKTLYGKYIYGDYCTGNMWYIYKNDIGSWVNEKIFKLSTQELSSFGQDNNGVIYAVAIGDGVVYKISEKCSIIADVEVLNGVSCINNSASGSASIEVSGSTDYIITLNGDTNFDLENLFSGEYEYVITDSSNGCSASGSFVIPIIDSVYSEGNGNITSICYGTEVNLSLFPTIEADSIYVYLNDVFLYKRNKFEIIVSESGSYDVLVFRNDCKNYINNFVVIEIFDELQTPTLSISNDTIFFSGNYNSFQVYKDDILLSTINENFIVIELGVDAAYKVVGIDFGTGCFSNPSDPLIISSTINNEISIFKFFPNPANDNLNFNNKIQELNIYTTTGINVKSFANVESNIDISILNNGIYILSARIGDKTFRGLLRVVK